MRRITIFAACIACALTAVAQSAKDTTIQQITLDSLVVTANPGPPVYRASATRVWDIKHTRIALSFNYRERTADAREWITLHPYFYPADTLVLDAKSMHIDSVMLLTKTGNRKLDYTYNDSQIKIRFTQSYRSDEAIELYLKYTAMPYSEGTGGSGAIRDDRGLYFINTDHSIPHKPAQIWTQGETEANSHWMITIDKPNTRFTTQVELTVPDSFVTLSNGAMIKQVKSTKGLRTDIWKMDIPIQAYVVMFAVGNYSIIKNKWHGKEVNYYVEPEFAKYGALMFNHTPEMMEYFSQRTGVAFPWNKYDQVVVRDYVSGAMENTSAALFGEFMNQNAREIADRNNEDIVSHELFHEWFGDYVTCESWSNLTVNESFANYGEQLWRAYKYGKASADELAYSDLTIYNTSAAYTDPQLVRFTYDSREEMFDAISYNKGGAILRYMNTIMGDAAFDRAMNLYLTKNALHSAEAHNWRLAVEEATGQDWNWFFNEYYYHAGHPVLKVAYNYNDTTQKLVVVVSQTQSTDSDFIYQLPLQAAIINGEQKTVVDWNISRKRDTFVYAYKNGVRPVVVPDYQHVMVGELKDGKKMPQWKVQLTQTDDYTSKRLAVAAAGKLLSDTGAQSVIAAALNDHMHSIRRAALSTIENMQNDRARRRFTGTIQAIAQHDSDKLVRAAALRVLGEWKSVPSKSIMVTAVYDSSYAVAGAALDAIARIDKDTAYLLAKELVNTNPKSSLMFAVWSQIGKKGANEDVILFERYGPYIFGSQRFSFATALTNYLKNVQSHESFVRGADVLAMIANTEGLKSFRPIFSGALFELAQEQKEALKSEKKDEAEMARKRLNVLKPLIQHMIELEKDPEILKEHKKKWKSLEEE